MSRLFQLHDDVFRRLFSWLDFCSLRFFDIAVGNVDERLFWLHSLHTIDSKAVDEYGHCHSSIRWLIKRGARTSTIRVRRNMLNSNQITDLTFAGVGVLSARNENFDVGDFLFNAGGVATSIGGIEMATKVSGAIPRNCGFANDAVIGVSNVCPNLTSIDLSHCEYLSDTGVSAIAQGCPHLTTINFARCHRISDVGVLAIAQGCPHLTSINLSNCHRISDIVVKAITRNCPRLSSIDLSDRNSTSDIGLLAIAQGCPQLTSIDLSICDGITDVGLLAIAEGCPQLISINLSICDQISEIGASAIIQSCPHLTYLDLSGCHRISDIEVSAITQDLNSVIKIIY